MGIHVGEPLLKLENYAEAARAQVESDLRYRLGEGPARGSSRGGPLALD